MRVPSKIKGCLTLVVVIFGLMVFFGAFFTIDETEQAVILQLGKPVRVILGDRTPEEMAEIEAWMEENAPGVGLSSGAGLYFKIPFLQQVRIFDDRLLEYDDAPSDVVTRDKKHLQVDCYARWRIQNPLLFLQSVQTVNAAKSRLDDIIYSVLRQEIGRSDLIHIVRNTNNPIGLGEYVNLVDNVTYSDTTQENITMTGTGEIVEIIRLIRLPAGQGREALLARVTETTRVMTEEYGIHVVDVRIKRADLPAENLQAVFNRMQAERNRISTRYRAEGHRMAQTILAETDLRVDSIRSLAELNSLRIRGTADSTAAAIYAQAYESYPDFYRYMQSLETLERVMGTDDELVLSTEGIFEYFVSPPGVMR
ncbi:MAG TPA: protease modulator HflC [Candidatus Sabulitectum sp.]|nr:protease modulator HflC [Candidatus Sabulitectum sp.]HPF32854.1 protease modulator HflC [Candidatus Sabulitectum sp.]HPJ27627.1 protease modulator HflC [Candidatus Sabulitectum sp.]HPR21397.1 protease modulator HflC [Candidatus Sabulitectum sp.]